MCDVTRILSAIEQGGPHAAGQLLPLVYDVLRRPAAQMLTQERPGQALEATVLAHEAYLRLVGAGAAQPWNSRGHFFAAAKAMRRILIDNVRRKKRLKRGGAQRRVDHKNPNLVYTSTAHDFIDLEDVPDSIAAGGGPVPTPAAATFSFFFPGGVSIISKRRR
jgi:RNA polymerase sigma factor (TIGR02999 family)